MCGHLKLLEKEYFGLEFRHHNGNYVRTSDTSKLNLKPLSLAVTNRVSAAGVVRAAEAIGQTDKGYVTHWTTTNK